MSINADWLKRRNAIDQELGGHASDVADVRLVQHQVGRMSRERMPCAAHWGTIGAGAANHMVGIKIDAIDGSAASTRNVGVWLQNFNASQPTTIFLARRSALTLTSENPITPGWRDPDLEVVPRLFEVDFLNTNIPTGTGANVSMFCSAMPGSNIIRETSFGLPGVFYWENTGEMSLYIIGNTAATIFHYRVQWQAVRI